MIIVLTDIAVLSLKRCGMYNVLLFLHRGPLDGDVHDNWHKHSLALFAPSPYFLYIDVLITVWATSLSTQPPVYAFGMEVVTAVRHEVRAFVKADRADLFRLVLVALRIPEHVRCVLHCMLRVIG